MGSQSYAGANNSVATGGHSSGGDAYAGGSVATGTLSKTTGKYAIAEGVWVQASGAGSIAMGSYANASRDNGVALRNNSKTSRKNTVSVGYDTRQHQIKNVAAGTKNTDAVNVQQLSENINNATNEMRSYTDNSSKKSLIDASSYTDSTKYELTEYINSSSQNVYEKSVNYTDARIQETGTDFTEQSTKYTDSHFADSLNYTDRQIDSANKRISNLDSKINKNRKRASAGIAGAMAMSAIPQKFSYEASFGMGIAHFDGEQAISAGGYHNLNNRTTVSLKTSLDTQNNLGIAAGLSYGW